VCSLELEAPRKIFGIIFLLTVVCNLKRGREEVACEMGGAKPRDVCLYSRGGVRPSAKMDRHESSRPV
jgi:hypothetical protein